MTLFLASQSPRRRELLNQIGVVFEPLEVGVDETPAGGESPLDYVRRVAREKAGAGLLQVAAVPGALVPEHRKGVECGWPHNTKC